jgi:hypothetical protein
MKHVPGNVVFVHPKVALFLGFDPVDGMWIHRENIDQNDGRKSVQSSISHYGSIMIMIIS